MRRTLTSVVAAACTSLAVLGMTGPSVAADDPDSQRDAAGGERAGGESAAAVSRAREHAAEQALGHAQAAVLRDAVLDRNGASHVRFDRRYRGLEVVGGDFVVHQRPGGALRSVSGREVGPLTLDVRPTLTARRAAALAARRVAFSPDQATPELVVLLARKPVLAYRVDVVGRAANAAPRGVYVFLDAHTGRTAARWPSVLNETGSGTGLYVGTVPLETTLSGSTYSLVDPLRGGNATHNGSYSSSAPVFTDADNLWGGGAQSAAVDAHYGIATTWDFYQQTYGRNGIGNDGRGARSYVHDGAYVNASWSDSCFCMRYGDGDGTTYGPLVELDIAGHEMTHGVTSRTARLQYRGESGGLNEASSDIMGTMVEFFAVNPSDPADYVVGEEMHLDYDPATNYIRRMDKPSSDGASQDCWSKRTRSVDVHYSSGPGNHFFYLLAEGSGAKTINGIAHNSPTCNGSTVTGIGRAAAGAIWYRALTTYMTSTTTYAGARVATVNAATDLYGATSSQVAAVKTAWAAVNVK